jgi:hypothetical protein
MTRCVVCGLESDEAAPLELASGVKLGACCPGEGECAALVWEAHFDRFIDASAAERAVTTWRWKRRRAEANGQPFNEPSPPERELMRWAK